MTHREQLYTLKGKTIMTHKDQLYTLDIFFDIEQLTQVTGSDEYLLESYKALVGVIPLIRLTNICYFHKEITENAREYLKIICLGEEYFIDNFIIEIDYMIKYHGLGAVLRRSENKEKTTARSSQQDSVKEVVYSLYYDGMKFDGQIIVSRKLEDGSYVIGCDDASEAMTNAFFNCFRDDAPTVGTEKLALECDKRFEKQFLTICNLIRYSENIDITEEYSGFIQNLRNVGEEISNHFRMVKLANMVVLNAHIFSVKITLSEFEYAWNGIAGWQA